jgi:predicted GH43/DUF377 family glycosyl hydrolase
MIWKKLGHIFCPVGEFEWMQSHAFLPIAENIEGDLFRIYFSTRDLLNRSHVGFIVVDINKPTEILDISESPVLSPGELGEFDDSGATATWLVKNESSNLLYYVGWNLGVTVPFRNSIGLAIGDANNHYVRYAKGPILDRSMEEPHFCASCCVIPDNGFWRMWYLSCTGWSKDTMGKSRHHYHIKYAESKDGIHWTRDGLVAIDYANESEYAISRPSVIRDADCWKMWYSFRGESYRIGYAESEDGRNWIRHDDIVGINVSETGWDSDMIEYPFIFDHKGKRYMLYNGNDYGKTGFGIAVLTQS